MEQGSQDDRETGKDAGKDPAGGAEGRDPQEPQAGNDEPEGEKHEGATPQPGETTPDDDSASETDEPGAGEDAGTADPGNSGSEASEDPGSEDSESESAPETTDATTPE